MTRSSATRRGLPQLPPQGAWGEVINATPRWLVIQNHPGSNSRSRSSDIGEFLVRWPASVDGLGAESLVEAVGNDLGSNVVRSPTSTFSKGADRLLVAPTYNSLLANNAVVTTIDPTFNRFMNAWDYAGQSMLYGWAYPFPSGDNGIPSRLHVVGSVIERARCNWPFPETTSRPSSRGQKRSIHSKPGDQGHHELRPQGRLCLPAAPRDQPQRAGGLAARPVQVDSDPAVQPRAGLANGFGPAPACRRDHPAGPLGLAPLAFGRQRMRSVRSVRSVGSVGSVKSD